MRFSVVIPTRRRPARLRACVASMAALDFPRGQFEIIVVDDGGGVSEPDLRGAAKGANLRILVQEHAGPAAARNRGVGAALGEVIAFTDDDCLAHTGWLRGLESALERDPEAMIGGLTHNASSGTVYSEASQQVVDFLYDYFGSDGNGARFFATNNVACRRDMLLRLGGFDERFPRAAAEDRDLCERWQEAGWRLEFEATAEVTHVQDLSLSRFARQHGRYGQGANYLHEARSRRGLARPRLEPLHFYWGLVTFPMRRMGGPRGVALSALAFLSQVSYGLGYYSERFRARFRVRAAAPAAFEPAESPVPNAQRAAAP